MFHHKAEALSPVARYIQVILFWFKCYAIKAVLVGLAAASLNARLILAILPQRGHLISMVPLNGDILSKRRSPQTAQVLLTLIKFSCSIL